MKIYPQVDVGVSTYVDEDNKKETLIKISTLVRLQDKNGVWYKAFVNYDHRLMSENQLGLELSDILSRFLLNVEITKRLYVVDNKIKNTMGEFYFDKDEDQRSEEERLEDTFVK